MKLFRAAFGILAIILAAALTVKAESAETAAELIEQAHKHDNMYTLGPEAGQQKALSLYESALASEPDDKQRLHILYRMAQLCGSSYDLSKGEKPDFNRAISIYKQIIDSYPPDEPLVSKAASSLCDHYTTLRDFESAVKWAKKVLEYDTTAITEQINQLEQQKQLLDIDPSERHDRQEADKELLKLREEFRQARALKKNLKAIKRYQLIAVDQVAYSATLIDPLRAHGELRAIAEKYMGTFIAERAAKLLRENMDKMPELWAPPLDLPASDNPSLRASTSAPAAITLTLESIQNNSYIPTELVDRSYPAE